ncbi:MAG TPA: NADH-quinone oxidoreductase subunit NuoK [Thermodesulfobacteriota bacterium]|nr:NADH-quinone oxidoreductase subunit NuoK [Thermodesulfobacteriota bacterium]
MEVTINHYVLLSFMLFVIGAFGVITRKNLIIVLMSLELMLNAANLALVSFSRFHGDNTGQVFMLMSLVVAACEVAVGLALVVSIYHNKETINIDVLKLLKG